MAVYKKTYRPYDGALTSSATRFLVIPRYAFEEMRKSRFLTIFFLASFIYPLIAALIIYVQHNVSALNLLGVQGANRRFLELETRGGTDGAFMAAIQGLGCEAAIGAQGRIKLVLPDHMEVRQLYEVASAQSMQIRRLNHKRDSLEDIFLKAMETADGRL